MVANSRFVINRRRLSWTIKLGVIISTNGRIINTGAAALFMQIGLFLLLLGSTGIGSRLSLYFTGWLRILAIILSPFVIFGTFVLISFITHPLFKTVVCGMPSRRLLLSCSGHLHDCRVFPLQKLQTSYPSIIWHLPL
jgi:hypothetical protein